MAKELTATATLNAYYICEASKNSFEVEGQVVIFFNFFKQDSFLAFINDEPEENSYIEINEVLTPVGFVKYTDFSEENKHRCEVAAWDAVSLYLEELQDPEYQKEYEGTY